MSDTAPEKFLEDRELWEVEDHIHFARTGERPLNPAYIAKKAEVLREGGFEAEAAELENGEVAPEDMSVADHFERQRQDR